jgi:two-component system OmpR family sensor kinase
MFDSLRTRLTLWYVAILAAALLAFSAGVYTLVERTLYAHQDTRLRSALGVSADALSGESQSSSSIAERLQKLEFPNQVVVIFDAEGKVLAQKPEGRRVQPCLPPKPYTSTSARFYDLPESSPDSDDACRGLYRQVKTATSGPAYFIAASESSELLSDELDTLQNVLLLGVVVAMVVAGLGGWFLARKSLAPLGAMAMTTRRITAESLDERVPVSNPRNELGQLATSFNELLSRLSASFARQRQFMADASHELRTPVSVMRTTAQVILEKTHRNESEYREALASVEQQTQRLGRIVNDMFTLARADSGGIVVESAELYLDEVLTEAAQTVSVLAKRRDIHLEMPALLEAPFRGDEGLLRQMFINLLDNAVKYTLKGGAVCAVLERQDSEYRVIISDTGVGIPAEAQPYIFDRFFREDKARTHTAEIDGAGLGLSIARWIAEVHRGRLELQHSDATGSKFSVSLPRT